RQLSPSMVQPPADIGPPPYEPPSQPGFIPPAMPADGSVPYVAPGATSAAAS
uniref:Uncharacterized protein n=1 Tax=Varanus komodoensis TaxID=61221 RepID=A0A8D2JH14_VARKO